MFSKVFPDYLVKLFIQMIELETHPSMYYPFITLPDSAIEKMYHSPKPKKEQYDYILKGVTQMRRHETINYFTNAGDRYSPIKFEPGKYDTLNKKEEPLKFDRTTQKEWYDIFGLTLTPHGEYFYTSYFLHWILLRLFRQKTSIIIFFS